MLWILANDANNALPPDDLATIAQSLYRCSNLHMPQSSSLFVTIRDSPFREIVRRNFNGHLIADEYLDEVHPHFSGDVCKDLMAVIELHLERGVR